jgi:DNA-binding MarR family transcriptional regulator
VLNRLATHPGSSAADLSRLMLITPQATQLALATLERKGLVERKPDPSGRRKSQCFLTDEGRRVVEDCRAEMHDVEHRLVASLTQAQRDDLATLLHAYLQK